MIFESISVGSMQVNCYILAGKAGAKAIIIDPGDQKNKIRAALDKHKLKPGLIINTHGHYDHIGCDEDFGVPVYIHSQDLELLRDSYLNLSGLFASPYSVKSEIKTLEDGGIIGLDDIELEVIHVPGHTPGGIALFMKKPKDNILFTGDALFYQGIGRADLPGGDERLLIWSIKERLLKLPDDTIIYPGHGPSSTISGEKKNNPFLMSA